MHFTIFLKFREVGVHLLDKENDLAKVLKDIRHAQNEVIDA